MITIFKNKILIINNYRLTLTEMLVANTMSIKSKRYDKLGQGGWEKRTAYYNAKSSCGESTRK